MDYPGASMAEHWQNLIDDLIKGMKWIRLIKTRSLNYQELSNAV
jgi:hypothetical protein